uniref:Uncharacterized protein n=1 Tax=Arundo donax TaxID=35708 RepID=A0A0A9BLH7_ARUDO
MIVGPKLLHAGNSSCTGYHFFKCLYW